MYSPLGHFETDFRGLVIQNPIQLSALAFPQRSRDPSPFKRSSISLGSDPKRRRTSESSNSSQSSHESSLSSKSAYSSPPVADVSRVPNPIAPAGQSIPNLAANGATLASPNEDRLNDRYNKAVEKLGTLVSENVKRLHSAPDWKTFVQQEHGPPHLRENLQELAHPAGQFLASIEAHGVPVAFDDEPWSLQRMDDAVKKGCHPTAQKHSAFIAHEMTEFMESGYWTVLPYSEVRHLPGVRGSPAHMKEELDRKDRFLADHTNWGVNEHTLPLAPKEAMQFGGALYRLCYIIRHADPKYGPVFLAKFDLKDGLYRMHLRPEDALSLTVVLPKY